MKKSFGYIAFLIFILILNSNCHTFAQLSISGNITDIDSNPLSNINVKIIDDKDSANVYTTTTDEAGYFNITAIPTEVNFKSSRLPENHFLLTNYPNPFNPTTIIYFEMPKSENIAIKIYDILGQEVRTLFDGYHINGSDEISWNARDNYNQPISAGVYLCRIETKHYSKVHKMVLLDGGSYGANGSKYNIGKATADLGKKISNKFNFNMLVYGDSILETSFKDLICENDTIVNFVVPKIYKSISIGVEGGVLDSKEFEMTIPNGAFSSPADLKLYIGYPENVNGNSVSYKYFIDGFPKNSNKSIEISIKPNSVLSGQNYIKLGRINNFYGVDSIYSDLVYDLFEAEVISGNLYCEIPLINDSTSGIGKITDDYQKIKLIFQAYSNGSLQQSSHFKVISADYNSTEFAVQFGTILESFENSFARMKDLNLNTDSLKYPIEIQVEFKKCFEQELE